VPIIRVTVIGNQALAQNAAKRLAEGAGRIFNSAPGGGRVYFGGSPV
jgi:hypothetical protein